MLMYMVSARFRYKLQRRALQSVWGLKKIPDWILYSSRTSDNPTRSLEVMLYSYCRLSSIRRDACSAIDPYSNFNQILCQDVELADAEVYVFSNFLRLAPADATTKGHQDFI